jgi:hypothetical protein
MAWIDVEASHPIRFEGRPDERYPALSGPREALRLQLPRHLTVMAAAFSEEIYVPDFLLWSFAQRSYALVDGFLGAFDTWNLLVAAPLVRLQIDTLVRLSYAMTCPDMDALTTKLLDGVEFRAMKDETGQLLWDRRLVKRAQKLHPWLEPVYEVASGWVHFSPVHLFLGTQANDGKLSGRLPLNPDVLPERLLSEVLEAMLQATRDLVGYLGMWAAHKAELAADHNQAAAE